jgi:hypothetical protein
LEQKSMVMTRTLDDFIAEAARQLKADDWTIARCRHDPGVVWHVAAHKGAQWLVVQVIAPGTAASSRQEDKLRLGEAARLPSKAGRMEQWLAHIQPGGRVTFGHDTLSTSAWAMARESDQQMHERLRAEFGRPQPG